MPRIQNVTRTATPAAPAAALPGVARSTLLGGQVYRRYDRSGQLGTDTYMNMGKMGAHGMYALNVATGEMSHSSDGTARVKVVGKGNIKVNRLPVAQQTQVARSSLTSNDVFTVKGGKRTYVHLGAADRSAPGRYVGVNTGSFDFAIGKARNVVKVGSYEIEWAETTTAAAAR